jgi:vitamin B12 transporter
MLNRLPFLALIPFTLTTPAIAAETADADSIVVTATGSELPADQTGQSITVLDDAAIRAIQGPDLSRALERFPGVAVARSGGLGATTGLFVRGADSDQVLVLLDGVRLEDNASTSGYYDLGNLLSGSIGRIELLRGSNSVIWGSQAVGGVLSIESRKIDGAEATAEYGAYNSTNLGAVAGIQRPDYGIDLNAGYSDSDGFSAKAGGTEPDGYRQWQVSGKAHALIADGLTASISGRHADSRLDLDLHGPNSADVQFTKEDSARAALDYRAGDLKLGLAATLGSVRRHYEDMTFGPSDYSGASNRFEFTGHAPLVGPLAVDFGADTEWNRGLSTFDSRQTARLSSGHALLGWYTGAFTLAGGVRVDGHSQFGTHATLGANGAIRLTPRLRVRAAYGEGFKAPSLYQLYDPFSGNRGLRPGTSRNYEAGFDWADATSPYHLSATVFRRDGHNQVDFDYGLFQYFNLERSRAQGVELEAGAKWSGADWGTLTAQAVYTYVEARDLTRARDLARRPRHTATVTLDWATPFVPSTGPLVIGLDLRVASRTFDYDDFALTTTVLAPYATVTLRAAVPVTEHIELFGRIENLGDKRYQTVANYNTSGRAAYVGIRGKI